MAKAQPLAIATGRRKSSVARVRLYPGTGEVTLNGKPLSKYFSTPGQQNRVTMPLKVVDLAERYDVIASVEGGGTTGQADAIRLGIARAIILLDPELRPALKKEGLLTRDSRKVERKKYGLRKARRAPQYTKR